MALKFDHILQFKIILQGIKPPIWRRIQIPSDYTFWDFHVAIQDAMGWQDSHLHHFHLKEPALGVKLLIGIPFEREFEDDPVVLPGWDIPVARLLTLVDRSAKYNYDFGDDWWHSITLECIKPRTEKIEYPICTAGRRACPPEDCGGVTGYELFLEAISDPNHEEHESFRTWLGESYDPDKFDKESIVFDDPFERWELAFAADENFAEEDVTPNSKIRIRIGEDETIPLRINKLDYTLLEKLNLFDPEYFERFKPLPGSSDFVGQFTLYDLEDMQGYVAAESNHTDDRWLEMRLSSLFDRISDLMDRYDDGN